jgi:hypothetical protein
MSEYQYYEFQTADRWLSEKEMQELRSYSTRAVIHPDQLFQRILLRQFQRQPKRLDGEVFRWLYRRKGFNHE